MEQRGLFHLRSIVLLPAILLIVATFSVPSAAAELTCESLERVVPTPAATVTVRTSSCVETYDSPEVSYIIWSNLTTVQTMVDAAYTVSVASVSLHGIATIYGVPVEAYEHSYTVTANDADSAFLRNADVGMENSQYNQASECDEATTTQASASGPASGTAFGQAFYGGSYSSAILPCTSEDVQLALP